MLETVDFATGIVRAVRHPQLRQLTTHELALLMVLLRAGGALSSHKEMLAAMTISPGTLSRMTERLCDKGFCHRLPQRGDRRKRGLMVTEEGMAMLECLLQDAPPLRLLG